MPWGGPDDPGGWQPVVRRFRDGRTETWWATDAQLGWWGPDGHTRLVIATTDPHTLPDKGTWYLATNLPRPGGPHDTPDAVHEPADLTEVVRLYGIRHWIEQSYKQVKDELGWADFQVRPAIAIRSHQTLVNCAFSFCWDTWFDPPSTNDPDPPPPEKSDDDSGEGAHPPTRQPDTPAGPKRYALSVPGSPHGSCYTAAGRHGLTNRHPASSNNSLTPSLTATPSTSIYRHKDDKLPLVP